MSCCFLFQATIDVAIGYNPPANAAPNPNDPSGDATVDGGEFLERCAEGRQLACRVI